MLNAGTLIGERVAEELVMGAALPKEREERIILTLPSDLTQRISDKAGRLGTSIDSLVTTLLRYGLTVQAEQEAKIESAAQAVIDCSDDELDARAEELGKAIFLR